MYGVAPAFNLLHSLYGKASSRVNMATKRRSDAAPDSASDIAANPQPQRKRTKQNSDGTNRDYTAADIKDFENGISKIKDWTSEAVIAKHVQVIYWFDIEHLSKEECVKRYPNKEGKPCSMTNIFKVYSTYAPRFYAEKGIKYIPLGKRSPTRVVKQKRKEKKTEGKSVKKIKRNPLDVQLEELFANLPDFTSSLPVLQSEDVEISPCPHHRHPSGPQGVDTAVEDTIKFLCKTGITTYGDPAGVQISRSSILRHCSTIRDVLIENPHIDTITHGPEVSADTICRFAANISEPFQPRLPDVVTTAYGTFEQEWSMAELEDLYVLAVTLGAGAVCDVIMDRLVEELRRGKPRIVVDEFAGARYFDVLDIGPELLNFLWQNDEKGFTFFANGLSSHGTKGYAKMDELHLANWHEGVKKNLIQMMEDGSVIDLFSASPPTVCEKFHHHDPSDFPKRLPERIPKPSIAPAVAPKTPLRPTLSTARLWLEDFNQDEQDALRNTLHLPIPRFPLTHRKHPQPHIDNITDDPIYALAPHGLDRLRARRTTHLSERLLYRNDKFNAHHDTAETNRLKLAMCREKVDLFAARGVEVSEKEVADAVEAQEKAAKEGEVGEEGGGSESEDEDGDEEMEDKSEEE